MPDHSASHASALSLVSNVALAGVKLLVGFVGNSYALIADGIESLADTISSVVVWSGLLVGSRQPDHDHPYGHGKAEAIATFIAGIGLMISGGLIAYQSIGGIISSEKQTPEFFTLPVLALIIIIKELLYRFMNRQAHKHDSQALLSEAYHHRADSITSLFVLVGISIALFAGKGFESADDYAALLVTVLIFRNGYKIIRPAIDELMDRHVEGDHYQHIFSCISGVSGVKRVETLWIRRSGRYFHVDVHIEVDPDISVNAGHNIAHQVKNTLMELPDIQIEHVGTHVEPFNPPTK